MAYFIPDRIPASRALASTILKNLVVYVEGSSDFYFWKMIFKNTVKIEVCDGCEKVIGAVSKANEMGTNGNLGIIDRDFRRYQEDEFQIPYNVFVSDEHDLEMMMYKSDAFIKVLLSYKVNNDERYILSQKDEILQLTDRIGYLKLANEMKNLHIEFKRPGHKGFDYPNYNNIITKDCDYISDEKLVDTILLFNNARERSKEILEIYKEMEMHKDYYDSWNLSNGHDFSFFFAKFLNHRFHPSHQGLGREDVEERLYLAFSKDLLEKTDLYKSLKVWEKEHKVILFA